MSEDVLERAEQILNAINPPDPAWVVYHAEIVEALQALAAEVRALRKDRERLDWLELVGAIITTRSNAVMGCNRKMIDFVMPARGEGGEDEMSEDVLEKARDYTVTMGDHWKNGEVHDLVCALAAEVRALRKDRERLEWLLDLSKRTDVGVVTKTYGALVHYAGSREELDAAMSREGEA